VTRIVLDQHSAAPAATGVVFLKGGSEYSVTAEREVILAAGAVQTPQILELSGIGRQDVLKAAGL